MNTNPTWTYIESFKSLPDTTFVYCDTRNFRILCIDDELSDKLLEKIATATDDNKFNRSEILGLLAGLEADSGGKRLWRIIRMKNHPGWCKYIRFVRTSQTVDLGARTEPVYVVYMESRDELTLLKRDDFDIENLQIS